MSKNMKTLKLPVEQLKLFDEMITHRRDTKLPCPDKKDLFYYQLLDQMLKYFKEYKDDYQKFLKMEYINNG